MENKKKNGFVEFWKRVWNWIKNKAKDLWAWIKAWFVGIRWMSKEQFDELVKKSTDNANEVWKAMDTDGDGWITTKDIKDWFKNKGE